MPANFPNAPSIGDTVIIGNVKYQWNGDTWIIVSGSVQNTVFQSNNGTIDLSKGNYHKVLIDPDNLNITTSFTNIPSGSSKWFLEFDITGIEPEGFNITSNPDNSITNWRTSSSFSSSSFNVNPGRTNDFFCISPDGTKAAAGAYINTSNYIFRIATLSTPFDVNTASVTYQSGNVHSLMGGGSRNDSLGIRGNAFFKDNNTIHVGTRYINASSGAITTSNTGVIPDQSENGNTNGTWTSDGLKFYTVRHVTGPPVIYHYETSTPFGAGALNLIRSTTLTRLLEFDNPTSLTTRKSVWMSDDGTAMFYGGTYIANNFNNMMIIKYNLSTPFNVNTASYSGENYTTSAGNVWYGKFVDNGDKFFFPSSNGFTGIANLTTPPEFATIAWPSSVIWKENTPPTITLKQNMILEFYTSNGGTTIYGIESINRDNTV